MSDWVVKGKRIVTVLGGVAFGASWASRDLAICFVLSMGLVLIVVASIASFTWLRTFHHIRDLAERDGRLPMINKDFGWDYRQPSGQGQLFPFPARKEGRRLGKERNA